MSSKPYKRKRFLCPYFLLCTGIPACRHSVPHVNDWRETCNNGVGVRVTYLENGTKSERWAECPNCVELANEDAMS